jgi:hypothetical protein
MRRSWLVSLLLFPLLALRAWSQAPAEVEVRDFAVLVDGKPAGSFQFRITPQGEGRTLVTAHASVVVRHIVKTYRYSFRGEELWAGDRLVRTSSVSNDDGKVTEVHATVEGNQAKVRTNRQQRTIAAPAGTTSWWRLPAVEPRTRAVALLDVDSGEGIAGKLVLVETIALNFGGKVVRCGHYRLTGKTQADVWFDEGGRLVRQQCVDDGHPVEWRLSAVRREKQ